MGRARHRHRLARRPQAVGHHLRPDDVVLLRRRLRSSRTRSRRGGSTSPAALVHETEGGPAVFLALGGSVEIEQKIERPVDVRVQGPGATPGPRCSSADRRRSRPAGPTGGDFAAQPGVRRQPAGRLAHVDRRLRQDLHGPPRRQPRIDIGNLAFTLTLDSTAGAEALVSVGNSALVIDPSDSDGFMAELLGDDAAAAAVLRGAGLLARAAGSCASSPCPSPALRRSRRR